MDYLYFLDKLPKKPYCTNDLRSGLKIRAAKMAIKYKYIQLNHMIINFLIFDIDRPAAALSFQDGNVAAPNFAVINKENQHAHLIYFLQTGVSKFPNSSLKAIKYLAAIEAAYTARLQADARYGGLIAKNPLNLNWLTWKITDRKYDLFELADYVDISRNLKLPEAIEKTGIGRNVDLFENGRKWAYSAVREFRQRTYQEFFEAVFIKLSALNNLFLSPLPPNEIVSTTKSISRWVWRMDRQAESIFKARQKWKAKLSLNVRIVAADAKKDKAIELKNKGYSVAAIAREIKVGRRQLYNGYFNKT